MRIVLSFLLLLFFMPLAAGTIEPATYVFAESLTHRVNFHDSTQCLPEGGIPYTIEEILNEETPDFVATKNVEMEGSPLFYWLRMRLGNASGKTITGELIFPSYSDTVWVYTVINDKVVDRQVSGVGFGMRDKNMRSSYNTSSFSLDPGVEKTIYCRVRHLRAEESSYQVLAYIGLMPDRALQSVQLKNYYGEGFFAGLMLLFGLVSAFMYFLFKERIFLYFAGLVLSFGLYSLAGRYVLAGVFNLTYAINEDVMAFAISGIVLFLYLFTVNYLQLRSCYPKLFKWYTVLTFLLILPLYLLDQVPYPDLGDSIRNYAIAVWMLFTISLIVMRAMKKDRPARILLLSIGALFIGGSVLVVNTIVGPFVKDVSVRGFQFGVVTFSSILFYSLFDKYNFLRSEKLRVEKLNELKSRFFANISHEFRTPLTLMMGPIQQVMEKAEDPQDKMLLRIAHRNAGRQLSLVNQLLDLAKAESGKLNLRAVVQDFTPLLRGTVYSFASLAEQKGLQLKVNSPDQPLLLAADTEKMEQIIINLLSNACKFTPAGGQITVDLSTTAAEVLIKVTDTGRGISPERLPHIFDRFFRDTTEETETMEGHGIGLALVKELVELHYGAITIASDLGKGTTVRIMLPRGTTHLQPGELLSQQSVEKKYRKPKDILVADKAVLAPEVETTASGEAPRVLLIEDNADVRTFIRQRLDPAYHITEAADGEAGVKKAIAEMPDLIISDVMMPKKSGYEVCQALKTDVRTCHIPVILLTAKATHDEKLEGLATGADDYLTKPFDANELALRVANLLRLRTQLRQRFATAISIRPNEIVTNSLDQEFLENALGAVEANMGNDDFNIDTLARAVGMSRPNLNRKFRALVNQSSNQFIQSIRLQRAADLLRRKAGSVGEIAFQTGFRSTAYFVKCFGDHFGMTPGSYAENPPETK